MAAQSTAESVKVVPFPSRRKCAELYSTSPILAAWSFRAPAELQKNPAAKANGSLHYRRSRCLSRQYAVNEFPILHDGNSVHKYELNPIRRLQRLLKRRLVNDAIRIEHRSRDGTLCAGRKGARPDDCAEENDADAGAAAGEARAHL